MDKQHPRKITYPISTIRIGDFPLLDELVSRSQKVAEGISLDTTSNQYFMRGIIDVSKNKTAHEFLDRARETGRLEPLASLAYLLMPNGVPGGPKHIQGLLLPYQQHVDIVMAELSQNINFQVQITPDNTRGRVIFNNGLIIMKSGGNYIVYRYSVEIAAAKAVAFEKLQDLGSPDLEATIKKFHNPNAMESPVLVHSRKSYSAREDILPYFAYSLVGLKK